MKIRPLHVGVAVTAILTLMLYTSIRLRKDALVGSLALPATGGAAPAPVSTDPRQAALESTPEARAYRSRQAFEQQTRAFLRDAPNLDDNTLNTRALALNREIGKREQMRELSAGEAVMLRIGLVQAAVKDESERLRQVQSIIKSYREQSAAKQRAFLAQQRRDTQFQAYKAREASIVSEVLAMQRYPDGMSRDDYLRVRLQEARESIYGAQNPPPTP
jgi:hypothetical protein